MSDLAPVFKDFDVVLTLTEPILGTVPKDPAVYANYIATKAPKPEDGEAEVETVAEIEERGWTGFHADDDGPFLYDYQIKGFLKEAGNCLQEPLGMTALRANIEKSVFVTPRKVRLKGELGPVVERPLRAMTAQGPRVTVVRSDSFPAGTKIRFSIRLFKNKKIKPEILGVVLDWGQNKGLGQFRNGGYGRFEYELTPR